MIAPENDGAGVEKFEPQMWDDLLTLLTMVILVDERVYREEVDAFCNVVIEIGKLLNPTDYISDTMAREWFKANRERTRLMLHQPRKNVTMTLDKLVALPHKVEIVEFISEIAIADNEYHDEEHNIIGLVCAKWGIPLK